MKETQAIDYIECARELNALSALLLKQATKPGAKNSSRKVGPRAGSALYWLWRVITEYVSEEEVRQEINKHEEE